MLLKKREKMANEWITKLQCGRVEATLEMFYVTIIFHERIANEIKDVIKHYIKYKICTNFKI